MRASGTPQVSNLPGIRDIIERALREGGVLDRVWKLRGFKRHDRETIALEIGPEGERSVRVEWSAHGGAPRPAFARGDRFCAAYSSSAGAWDVDAAETPTDVRRRALEACRILADLDMNLDLVAVNAVASDGPELVFERKTFEGWLRSEIAVGSPWVDGWCLEEVYPHREEYLVLAFSHTEQTARPKLRLRLRDDARPAGFRSRVFDIVYRGNPDDVLDTHRKQFELRLAAEMVFALDALEASGVRFRAPEGATDGPAPEVSNAPARALNLAIPAPCGQKCSFCSVRDEIEAVYAPQSAFVKGLMEDIRRSARDGVKILRLNGIEPLNADYLFDLLALVRESAFEEVHLLSSCRPLADRSFCERYLAAMPDRYRIYVPIYGPNAEIHDAGVGVPGAFDTLMQAVAHLRDLMDERGELLFTTVLMRSNYQHLAALRDLVRPLGVWWEVHQAFPNTSSANDRYRDIAISMTEAMNGVYPNAWWPIADIPWGEVLPCVALDHQRATGHELLTLERFNARVREPAGTFYATAGFEHSMGAERADALTAATVACPHRAECALSRACPGKVYNLYADLFGLDELKPVTPSDIASLPDAERLTAALEGLGS